MARRLRVFVVDDVRDAAEMLVSLLQAYGYEASHVTDPRVAVETAKRFQPDIVLVDIGMPHINGYELAPLLRRALPERVRLIAVTAWGSEQDRRHSKAVGFDQHLVKPVDDKTLRSTIDQLATR